MWFWFSSVATFDVGVQIDKYVSSPYRMLHPLMKLRELLLSV